jgi:two-component system chemotaxis response regulator CheY
MGLAVLIVDDSSTVRSIITKTLSLLDLPIDAVAGAGNGIEALDVMRSQWIDLVFTDINMPDMNGLELLEAMRSDDIMKGIPVIVVSTEGSEERIDHIRAMGVPYVRKPFTPETIKHVIEEVLGAYEH